MELWMRWALAPGGGCLFVAASSEFDDLPDCPVRQRLLAYQRDWLDSLAQIVRSGQADGKLRADLEPEQIAFELDGITLAVHHAVRLFGEDGATRGRAAVERLLRDISSDPGR
jgi:hypothetical protein